jgi:hypothetical protein
MARKKQPFDVKVFLNTVAEGRTISKYQKGKKVFSQGDLWCSTSSRGSNGGDHTAGGLDHPASALLLKAGFLQEGA